MVEAKRTNSWQVSEEDILGLFIFHVGILQVVHLDLVPAIAWRYDDSGVCCRRGFSAFASVKSM